MSGPTHDSRLTIHDILHSHWGFSRFRPLQEEIIQAVLENRDTLALMPTGGGKSLCYQVPALAREGLCLVISPLIALMKDQVANLRAKNITAFAIYSGMTRKEVIHTLKVATDSNCKFLYVSPERLETSLFKEYLPALHVNLVAVDEAHCISQWGYDFRPPYLRIARLREELPGVPVLALTASATPEVQDDICEKLAFPSKHILRGPFERKNLSFSVFDVDAKPNKILDVLKKVPGSSIVYCKSRRRTQEVSDLLRMHGIAADYYHAGLDTEQRSRKQEAWIRNEIRVIVCTNAFGMGIDKPDVRTVIHADIPDCLENYYQEAGRAGRDEKNAFAVLLYSQQDLADLDQLADTRFPGMEDIRKVYSAVCNYLAIPSGSGDGVSFDFDLGDFLKKFKLDSHTVIYALKALEQDGWLGFSEHVFLPPTVSFRTSKEPLYDFEKQHPSLEPIVKALLRAYEGIFDFPVPVSEIQLARLMGIDAGLVKDLLKELDRYAIIEYKPQKEQPQLYLLKNRVKDADLAINTRAYNERKERFIYRVRQMRRYILEPIDCRSRMIGLYFGDELIKKCGICDNCLRQKSISISTEEFSKITRRIESVLAPQPLPAAELLDHLGDIQPEKAWKVIDYLQAEQKIEMDKGGWVRLR